jgi:hypothetical protein
MFDLPVSYVRDGATSIFSEFWQWVGRMVASAISTDGALADQPSPGYGATSSAGNSKPARYLNFEAKLKLIAYVSRTPRRSPERNKARLGQFIFATSKRSRNADGYCGVQMRNLPLQCNRPSRYNKPS